jgi:hypothetical protein
MDAGLEELAHRKIGQCHGGVFLYRFCRREALRRFPATGATCPFIRSSRRFACELRPDHPDAPRI